jgi:hypothetical protein
MRNGQEKAARNLRNLAECDAEAAADKIGKKKNSNGSYRA